MARRHVISVLLPALLSACGGATVDGPGELDRPYNDTATNEDVDAPLSDVDALTAGAPGNDALPSESKADASYPKQFDLKDTQSPVRSQGGRGVCSIFSTVALAEHLYLAAGQTRDFSEQYLQWSVKNEVGAFKDTAGSSASDNVAAISRFGIVEESAWRYETSQWGASQDAACVGGEKLPTRCYTNGEPPAEAVAATKYKLPAGRWVNSTAASIKGHLHSRKTGVVIGGTFFYQAWNHRASTLPTNQEHWRGGYVLAPNAEDRTASLAKRAGHSILIVGWDDDLRVQKVDKDGKLRLNSAGAPLMEKGFFLFKNSWGTGSFGVNNPKGDGYGWISYKYVAEHMSAVVSDLPQVAAPVNVDPVGGSGSYESTTSVEIPDDDAGGATSTITVPDRGAVKNLSVEVDIAHTYRGDLTVVLEKGGKTATIVTHQGGGEDDLVASFEVDAFDGAEGSGSWTLRVVDDAAQDTGTLRGWGMTIAR